MAHEKVKIFGVKVSNVTIDEAYDEFLHLNNEYRTSMIFTPNTEFIMAAQDDEEFRDVLNEGDIVLPDGIGLIHASNMLKLGLKEKVAGVDFMNKLIDYANKTSKSIYILGGTEGTAEQASIAINEKYSKIKIAGFHHGYFEEKDELKILDKINDAKPDLLIVALGFPRQEKWIYKHRKILNCGAAMGVGGAIDIWAGNSKRAPKIFIKLGLEWLYRGMKQPERIGRLTALPKFMIKVFKYKYLKK